MINTNKILLSAINDARSFYADSEELPTPENTSSADAESFHFSNPAMDFETNEDMENA